ncbi:MAG TPA: DUF3800 domain-containing protein [Dehalococcoidia bacterium]|nr:DUF3800 domain-containing protein [Dehalococcoidia bacterium]
MVDYIGYFDESGTHDGSEIVAVAGCLATVERLERFTTEWAQLLAEFDLEMFRMSQFAQKAPPFDRFSEDERRLLLSRVYALTGMLISASVATAIPMRLFNEIFSPSAKAICGGAYGLAVAANMLELADLARATGPDAWIAYVFESGAKGTGEVMKVFTENERDPNNKNYFRLLSIKFENKRQFLPLQAADVFAYEIYQHALRQFGYKKHPVREYSMFALSMVPNNWGVFEEAELRKWNAILALKSAGAG